MKLEVEFEFSPNDRVDTPFVKGGVVVMLGYESEDIKSYYVENSQQGVTNKWFRACDLTLAE